MTRRRVALLTTLGVTISSAGFVQAGPVWWTEDFEAYPTGTVDGRDTTWDAHNPMSWGWTGEVKLFDGDKALENEFIGGTAWGTGEVIWWNDTGWQPSGIQEIAFSVYPVNPMSLEIDFYGRDAGGGAHLVTQLDTNAAGSPNSVDMYDATLGWVSGGALLTDQWNRMTLQIDFDSPGDPYLLKVNNGPWSGPFTNGSSDSFTVDRIRFWNWYYQGRVYYDDFVWQVPEPATLSLLALGGLVVLRRRKGQPNTR